MNKLLTKAVLTKLTKLHNSSSGNAKKKGINFAISKAYLETLYIGCQGICPMTGIALETISGTIARRNPRGISIDRIDNSLGYEEGNVRLVSTWFNNAKGAESDEFFFAMTKIIQQRQNALNLVKIEVPDLEQCSIEQENENV